MMDTSITSVATRAAREQNLAMQRYYRLQSKIYDATRWSFLFGRQHTIRLFPFTPADAFSVLEVGCGTGYNTQLMAKRFLKARITSLDVSTDMVDLARRRTAAFGNRVQVLHQPYEAGSNQFHNQPDLILFSYSLTMINPQWHELLRQAARDLKPGGILAAVDFHDSRLPWFKRHMSKHHVRMDGHLLPVLRDLFQPLHAEVRPAYRGMWQYLMFLGKKEG